MEDARAEVTLAPIGTPEEFHRELVALATEFAPRRFAICAEHGERWDGAVVAWGMAFPDLALYCLDDDPQVIGRVTGAESALRLLCRSGDQLRLIWIDEPSPGPADSDDPETNHPQRQYSQRTS